MEVVTKELCQFALSAHFYSAKEGLFYPYLLSSLRERYDFQVTPNINDMINQSAGVEFIHGIFGDAVIDKATIFSNGVLVQSKSSVERCEEFVDDLLNWGDKVFGIKVFEGVNIEKTYDSHLVVCFNAKFDAFGSALKKVIQLINSKISSYNSPNAIYDFAGFSLIADTSSFPVLKPSKFLIERRLIEPFSANLYYSTAPLTTADHIEVLENIEMIFSSSQN